MNKVSSGVANKTNIYANIQKITYPTSATSEYTYEKISGSLGTGGYKEYYRVKIRADNEADSTSYKSKTYDYTNEYNSTGNFMKKVENYTYDPKRNLLSYWDVQAERNTNYACKP